ncbi:penicillin-binding transpeptidase domain-containing protein [Quadrisphaera sp. DSM 44207]|uniref:penicillin-binding transpeptidase domain-containing protein n=1 Tax=Quadrisphaera sp. DSM 44207 TaxID=1881057 RepID=UPI000882E9A9|nr:penicillin-binding transpeptidase domain-containing protein [Quadrisphaera sp. DSM 44207]SDQ12362.1 Cell division protein FtsI/penicillin-binding protein 2 [Quadrisphaera sp. DSM 44207]
MRRGRGRTLLVVLASVLVLALVAAAVVLQRVRAADAARDEAARAAAEALASAWEADDLTGARFAAAEPAAVQEQYAAITDGLGEVAPQVDVTAVGRTELTGTARLSVTWPVGQGWRYETTAALAPVGGSEDADAPWGARWEPALVHPDLAEGDRLTAERTAAPRAEVLGRDGAAIVTEQPVVEVGVQPSRTSDPAGLAAQLADVLDVDAEALTERITSSSPDAFVPVVTLRRPDYDAVRERVQPLPGTVFRESTLPLAPTREFARALLGTVGTATEELVEQSEGRLQPGDATGLSGLQRRYDERLTGTPGVVVRRVPAQGEAVELHAQQPVAGEPVQLTLDAAVQRAADAALGSAPGGNGNAALVAIDVPSGDVLAVANTPVSGADRALSGQYPPGSTFKTVSTLALLGTGLTPDEVVDCPPTTTVQGRSFRNFEGGAFGAVPFRTDFAQSCNTAFVQLSSRLGEGDLTDAAASVGLGGDWSVGVDAFPGDVPPAEDAVERAAATIGQGRVLASPLAMASSTATIARGGWVAPRLVTTPAPQAPAGPAPSPDPARLAVVRDLMREVATSGTASALADVPGSPVHAKTGTAEHGTEVPPRTHAWTVGFRGDVAFAVLVEDGASGGSTAVPVAEAFLRALPA